MRSILVAFTLMVLAGLPSAWPSTARPGGTALGTPQSRSHGIGTNQKRSGSRSVQKAGRPQQAPPAQGVGPQSEATPSFSASVDLVLLHVAVFDDRDVPVPGLTRADFTIVEDGQPQPIRYFAAPASSPLDVALLVDTSGSVETARTVVRRVVEEFLPGLGPQDCVLALPFAGDVPAATWASGGSPRVSGVLAGRAFEGSTRLNDALIAALDRLADRRRRRSLVPLRRPRDVPPRCGRDRLTAETDPARQAGEGVEGSGAARRQAIVLVSDGVDEGSASSGGDALTRIWSARVPVLVVPVGAASPRWHENRELDRFVANPRRSWYHGLSIPPVVAAARARRVLEGLARASGGWVLDSEDALPRGRFACSAAPTFSGIRVKVAETPDLGLAPEPDAADYEVKLRIHREPTSSEPRLEAALMARVRGSRFRFREDLEIDDVLDTARVRAEAGRVVEVLRRWIDEEEGGGG